MVSGFGRLGLFLAASPCIGGQQKAACFGLLARLVLARPRADGSILLGTLVTLQRVQNGGSVGAQAAREWRAGPGLVNRWLQRWQWI